MKIALIQQSNTADTVANIDKLQHNIRQAATQDAKLIVLQELHNSLYFCQTEDVDHFAKAETIPGVSTDTFGKLAKELQVVIVLSLFEQRATGLYHNTAVVIDTDGHIAGKYRKMHIPDDPAYYEKFYFTPGDLGFQPIDTSIGRLGVLICWDQWYPEAARMMALAGADLLIYPTAIGWESTDTKAEQNRQKNAWQTIQRSHAIANGIPVVSCNRVGHEPDPSHTTAGIDFWGGSFVADQQGDILLQMEDKEEVAVVEVEIEKTATVRHWWPFFRDRRIDAYGEITQRWRD